MKIERICPNCGKRFFISESRLKYGRGKYCSKKCKYESGNDGREEYVCAYCGKKFKRYSAHIKSQYQFCSPECSYKARGIGLVKRIIIKPYNCRRKIFRKCEVCGSDYLYTKTHQKYCSRECVDISHRTTMKGENNPSYIDGRSKNKKSYRGDEWESIRICVYKRDGYTCRVCGKHCGRKEIQAHHIIKYKETSDNSMENLVTVCNKCHPLVENDSSLIRDLKDVKKCQ